MDPVSNLKQALPYLLKYRGRTFVVAPASAALSRPGLLEALAEDLSLLHNVGIDLVVACAARDNTALVAALRASGTLGVAISGGDGALVEALRPPGEEAGGEAEAVITHVEPKLVRVLTGAGYVPVIGAQAATTSGGLVEVGTEAFAAQLALALGPARLFFLTDRARLLRDPADARSLVRYCDVAEVERLLAEGGPAASAAPMRLRLEAALAAITGGVPGVHLVDAHQPSALLQEVFTPEGVGTLVVADRHALDTL